MRFSRPSPIYIGFVFFISFGLIMYQAIIERAGTKDMYPYTLKIYYPKSEGIRPGTPVSILGVEKGLVRDLDVVPIEDVPDKKFLDVHRKKAVEITIRLSDPITLYSNYGIYFRTATVLSGRTIDIDPGSAEENPNEAFFNPTFKEGQDIVPDFSPSARYYDDFFAASTGIIRENRDDIRLSFKNMQEISAKLGGEKGSVPRLINSYELYDRLSETVYDMRLFGDDARRYMEGYRKLERNSTIPFSINLYRRTTLIGNVSNDFYFNKL
ncbi:mammalian cell entry protein [Leptospira perolatii]|uniref:Mammalian cell entry protein n=1 Tax=Leptospira perolatii TaxID=2023191 RepID=A0A2M9ZSU7_9LEPT|nr:MCE family protein [Leptospira perolatii]PJZ71449.1 mammalian cell entry protein [Leptospira perolatii]PJZ74983.1 mammalian cell entry protein [Leptospira perolatii]